MDWNKLKNKVYKCAANHGFHNERYSDEHWIMLIITEISEAINADRVNHHADLEDFESSNIYGPWKYNFERCIKDTVEDELADVAIRLLDFAGVKDIDLSDLKTLNCGIKDDFCADCFDIVESIVEEKDYPKLLIENGFYFTFLLANKYHINLYTFIKLKMRYNELRLHKNGKNY